MSITFASDPSHQRAGLPGRNADWDDYRKALKQQDEWFQNRSKYKLSVLGETESYRHTIGELREVVRRDWDTHGFTDQQRLLGLLRYGEHSWCLLGRMRDMALEKVFMIEANRRKIEAAVSTVVEAPDEDAVFRGVVIKAYRQICSIEKVRGGVASRLLTLARPDRCVSVNGASRHGLAAAFGLAPTTLDETGNYDKLLECLYELPWFRTPEPKDLFEREIWSMRAALIDCFVYWPEAKRQPPKSAAD